MSKWPLPYVIGTRRRVVKRRPSERRCEKARFATSGQPLAPTAAICPPEPARASSSDWGDYRSVLRRRIGSLRVEVVAANGVVDDAGIDLAGPDERRECRQHDVSGVRLEEAAQRLAAV